MAKEKKTKKSSVSSKSKKTKGSAKGKGRAKVTAPLGINALSAITDEEAVQAQFTSSQCIVWRQGEFRKRVKDAVAAWAQESPASILPNNTLGELAKGSIWNTGQQGRLVQSVKAHNVFAPPFPETTMVAPSQLLPASTTVAQWERVVWRHQDPETPCFPFTD